MLQKVLQLYIDPLNGVFVFFCPVTVYNLADKAKILEEGVSIAARYITSENILCTPKPKRGSDPATAPPSYTPTVTAGKQGMKRKAEPLPQPPAKKLTADKPPVSRPSLFQPSTPSTSASHFLTPKATKRPASSYLDTSHKKHKASETPTDDKKTTGSDKPTASVSPSTSPSPSVNPKVRQRPGTPELETQTKKPKYDSNVPAEELLDQSYCYSKSVPNVKRAIKLQLLSRRS
ncbi:threonine-rich protein-like [Acanthochromis polyacanthus]|uniref:threonine-rich protein-like n=1 Tax=Acanthochromis polyacanthus TaxID=80966 RepID=UPI002234ABCA|nr:threonine-rich protein-like [Acanthochromis polyacanthus]